MGFKNLCMQAIFTGKPGLSVCTQSLLTCQNSVSAWYSWYSCCFLPTYISLTKALEAEVFTGHMSLLLSNQQH